MKSLALNIEVTPLFYTPNLKFSKSKPYRTNLTLTGKLAVGSCEWKLAVGKNNPNDYGVSHILVDYHINCV